MHAMCVYIYIHIHICICIREKSIQKDFNLMYDLDSIPHSK